MAKIKSRMKRVSLAFMGQGWEEAYIDFKQLRWGDVAELADEKSSDSDAMDKLTGVLKRQFVAGRALGDDDQLFDLQAEDIVDLDLEALTTISQELGGAPSPNS